MVESERIDWHCNAQRLSIEQRLALFGDVLAALAHAHSHLVIHRNIKLNNIFVTLSARAEATLAGQCGREALAGFAHPEWLGSVLVALD